MPRPSTLLLIAIFIASAMATAQNTPLLLETSFEQGADLPEGWTRDFGQAGQVLRTPEAAHEGGYGVRLHDTSVSEAAGLRSAKLAVEPGQSLWVKVWSRNLAEGGTSVYFEYWNAAGQRLQEYVKSHGLPQSETWRERTIRGVVPPGATHFTVLLYCYSKGTCDAVFDDLRVGLGDVPMFDRTPRPPAQVEHPCGPYSTADLERAKQNIASHEWAAKLLESFKRSAQTWMDLSDQQIHDQLPELTPFRAVFCPRCRYNWDYCWSHPDPEHLKCRNCGLVWPNDEYPESHTTELLTPTGKRVEYRYYEDPQGRRYWLSGRVRYGQLSSLGRVGNLGRVYALTGDVSYAKQAVKVLRRLAEVYPDWIPHDWTRIYTDYSNTQSGKMSGWKLHDCTVMLELALCYDLIYDSGALTDDDKTAIENNVFRELGEALLPITPRGCCINDGPYQMACAAYLGRLLGDHRLIAWAVEAPEGFLGFLRDYFFRDGHWEDGSPSYEGMALSKLYLIPEILQGYSDPASYTKADRYDNLELRNDPLLKKIHTAGLYNLWPDRTLPPINDGAKDTHYATRHAEVNDHWYPSDQSKAQLKWVFGDQLLETGSEYTLFRRDPDFAPGEVQPLCLNDASLLRPGLGWAYLRHGTGEDRTDLVLDYGEPCGWHGHPDRLNLLLYANRREVVTDLGYLGARHEQRPWMAGGPCHNVVLVDGQPQARRAGRLLLFAPGDQIQAVVAEAAETYDACDRYERTVVMLNSADGVEYLVDVFRVSGGSQHDYAFHGDGQSFVCPSLNQAKSFDGLLGPKEAQWGWLKDTRLVAARGEITADWRLGKQDEGAPEVGVRLRLLDTSGELFVADGPNLRNRRTPFEQPTTKYLYQRRPGPRNTFIGVLEPLDGQPVVGTITRLPVDETDDGWPTIALRVEHPAGTDLVLCSPDPQREVTADLGGTALQLKGRLGVVSLKQDGSLRRLWLQDGTVLSYGDQRIQAAAAYEGTITAVDQEHYTVTVDQQLPTGERLAGRTLLAPRRVDGAYPIASAEPVSGGTLLRLADEPMMELQVGEAWRLPVGASR